MSEIIRCFSTDLPQNSCRDYFDENNRLVTVLRNDSIEYVVTFINEILADCIAFYVSVLNKSENHFVVSPEDFLIQSGYKIFKPLYAETLSGRLKKRGSGKSLFSGVNKETAQKQIDAIGSHQLLRQTLFENDSAEGVVFFQKENFGNGFVLCFLIGDITYQIPFGNERAKLREG